MDIRIKTTDYQMTGATAKYLNERLAALGKFFGGDTETTRCEVELGRAAGRPRHGKNIWFAEVNIFQPGAEVVRATNHAETINAAIDDVKEEVELQLRKEKRLHTRILRKSGAWAKRLMRYGGLG